MQVVYKYKMNQRFETFNMPAGAIILDPKLQQGNLVIWAMHDPDAPPEPRHFAAIETGPRFDIKIKRYLGTTLREYDNHVLHVFELYEPGH